MEETVLAPPTPEQIEKYHNWWSGLSVLWKKAFNEAYLRQTSEESLSDELMHTLWNAPALRFAGPTAMHPNMTFELEDLSGITALTNVTILVVVHQQITSLEPLVALTNLQSLFVFNNQLTDISPVAKLGHLKELYFQSNLVESLQPLEHLTGLKTIYCNYNRIASLEGIGEQHADTLNQFICLPNELLRDREVMRFEREAGIRVTKA